MNMNDLGYFLFMEEKERIEKEKLEAMKIYSENESCSWWEKEPQHTDNQDEI